MGKIVLASASPRRIELLGALGLKFDVVPSKEEEVVDDCLSPDELVRSLARRKAAAVARLRPSDTVIGADTVVVLNGMILGKPADSRDACAMLSMLEGKEHEVFTGVCVICRDKGIEDCLHEVTKVRFCPMSKADIENYVATGEPMDKAGAYAIQGLGSLFVSGITGDYFNVVGLPLRLTASMLIEAGTHII